MKIQSVQNTKKFSIFTVSQTWFDNKMEVCSVCALFGEHKSHKMVEIKNLGSNIKELSEQSKGTMKSLSLFEDFKKHSTFAEYAADKMRLSSEFNKRQLQIIYKNLKNILKTRIFGNLETVQKHLEEQIKDVFSDDLPEFKQYKKLALGLETKLAEINSMQKESSSKDVFVFTRLSKLQGDFKTLKRADLAFKALTDKCFQFNIETELNFQLFEELIIFKNEYLSRDKIEYFRNGVQSAFEKPEESDRLRTQVDRMQSMISVPEVPHMSQVPNMMRKQSLQVLRSNPPRFTMNGVVPGNMEFNTSIDKSSEDLVPAVAFIEQNQKNMRSSVNPRMLGLSSSLIKPKTAADQKPMTPPQQMGGSVKRNQLNPIQPQIRPPEQPEKAIRNFKKQPEQPSQDGKQLFQVKDECAVVTKLMIDADLFQTILDKISDCPTFITQIIFKGNTFKINPIHSLLDLFEGPVNESLTIDFRENKFPDGTKFLELDVYELEKLNVFVLV